MESARDWRLRIEAEKAKYEGKATVNVSTADLLELLFEHDVLKDDVENLRQELNDAEDRIHDLEGME